MVRRRVLSRVWWVRGGAPDDREFAPESIELARVCSQQPHVHVHVLGHKNILFCW